MSQSTGELLHFGVPYAVSSLLGAGTQLFLPMMVLHLLGQENVGFYRASISVSVAYMGIILTTLGRDFYPRLSAVKDNPELMGDLINTQQRFVMLLSIPIILITLGLAPYIIPLLYSRSFVPTVGILEWQLLGDFFKVSTFAMAYVILARCSGATYFMTELSYGVLLLCGGWLGARFYGIEGLGTSFLGSYFIYFWLILVIVRREIGYKMSAANVYLFIWGIVALAAVRITTFVGLEHLRTPIALTLGLGSAFHAAVSIAGETTAGRRVLTNCKNWGQSVRRAIPGVR